MEMCMFVYFHQHPLDASFHQFLGSFINNDYANLCVWILLKLLKFNTLFY
jgi:hypothetical protein